MTHWQGPIRDERADDRRVLKTVPRYNGKIWDVRTDTVDLGDAGQVERDVLIHTGAVGIIALDDQERVLLIRQYRHPVAAYCWEPPAGLLDVDGEDPAETAKRELFEETGYRARTWHVLVDFFNSPGASSESFRCYLARDLEQVSEEERHEGEHEELDMPIAWLPLDEALEKVLTGQLHNPTAVTGLLATVTHRARNWRELRPADAPWEWRIPKRAREQP
jgi:ADP-ribose pyrophosphatase